jgi:general secretion pathway protein G
VSGATYGITTASGNLRFASAALAERRCTGIDSRIQEPLRGSSRPKLNKHKKNKGFSVVELLIVMAVIMTVSAMAIPNLVSALDSARVARAVGDIRMIEDQVGLYNAINGKLPDDLSQVGCDLMLDPWKAQYQYYNHASSKGNGQSRKDHFLVPLNSDYDLYSMGKDGKSSPPITANPSQDDILRAADGSYIGLASLF